MKIALITFYYFPIQNPRAFRSTELAEELSRMGHEVTVYNGSTVRNYDYYELTLKSNVKVINLNVYNYDIGNNSVTKKTKKKMKLVSDLLFYFTTNALLKAFLKLRNVLNFTEKYDILISIGLPFHIHWAVSDKIKANNIADLYIADYGDPFSKFNKTSNVAPYFRAIEKRKLQKFDYITVPNKESVKYYTWLKDSKNIKVIPQGFNLANIKLKPYVQNSIPKIAYAGIFYEKIREPNLLFEVLNKINVDFEFHLFVPKSGFTLEVIEKYKEILGEKLIIRDMISRIELIEELSQMDFLVNINNLNTAQSPSKLIDYVLSGRPIFSCDQNKVDEKLLREYLNFNFSRFVIPIELSDYEINTVANKFLKLYNERFN